MRTSMKLLRLSIPPLLTCIFLVPNSRVFAEKLGGEAGARQKIAGKVTDLLRERIAELEEQNAVILRQLAGIRNRLDHIPIQENNGAQAGNGQSFNTATGEKIGSRGGWVELGLRASRYAFSTGFTIDDPENEDLLSGARTKNRAWYVTNQFRLAPPVLLGLDYLHWKTNFKGREEGIDNRVNLYLIYNF